MATTLIFSILWLPFILTQIIATLSTFAFCCKKKKPAAPGAPGTPGSPAPAAAGDGGAPLPLDKTQDVTLDPNAASAAAGGAGAGANGGKSKEGKAGATIVKTTTNIAEDPDLKSRTNYNNVGKTETEIKPMSTLLPTGNDKFVSKGNGIFVDKDGNPISQLAEPPAKDV